jgi:pyrimidine operon attenuation protein/uracil phosphoribosyltransferase
MSQLTLDAEALYQDMLTRIRSMLRPGTRLLGIASGGVWLAERMAQDLPQAEPVGVISSAMHRDDFARRGMTSAEPTRIPFDVNGADILLLDDVLYTGRTVRAVMNELFDFGRPARVALAVMVDRGGRELPIQPDLCMARISLPANQSLALSRDNGGRFSFNVKVI